MDFFNMKGCSKWDDAPDDKTLHSSLFLSPAQVSPNKWKKGDTPKAKEMMQDSKINSEKKRKLHQDRTGFTKKPRQSNPQNAKVVHLTQVKDANTDTQTKLDKHPEILQIGDEPQSPKKKKKRKRKNSLGDGGKDGVETKHDKHPKNKSGKVVGAESYETSPGSVSRTLSTDDSHKGEGTEDKPKKKRKRKPRHNKFKDAEGNVKPQYKKEHATPDIQKPTPNRNVPPMSAKSQLSVVKSSDTITNQNKKNQKKSKNKSSANKNSMNGARSKLETFEQAKEAVKKRKRVRKRKRSISESSNPDVDSQNSKAENQKMTDISESEESLKSSKSVKNDTNNNSKGAEGQNVQKLAQDGKRKFKVKRNRGKKAKKQSQGDQLYPDGAEPEDVSPEEHSDDDDADEEVHHKGDSNQKKSLTLQSRLENQLRSSHFRFLNEKFYQCSGSEAFEMVSKDKDAFEVYHEGYSQQVEQWPVNPVDVIIKQLKSGPSSSVIGDFGCGEAQIAQTIKHKVHSFDLCALNKHVTVCDVAQVPLGDDSLDVAVFCLSLMGTNWIDYVREANRVLKTGGTLKVAEVASRFQSIARFLKIMKSLGFNATSKDFSNKMFYLFNFTKQKASRGIDVNKGEILKPCLYKKR